jgi:cold shock CspA family protein
MARGTVKWFTSQRGYGLFSRGTAEEMCLSISRLARGEATPSLFLG